MREIKYIVPPGLEHIKVSEKAIEEVKMICAEKSCRTRVVLLGRFDGLVCLCLCGGLIPRRAYSPTVFAVADDGTVEELTVTPSLIAIKAAVAQGVDENLLARDE